MHHRITCLKCFTRCSSYRCLSSQKVAPHTLQDNIVIPKRIPRSPTDILKALASTVSRDVNAPHYKYGDDPFLTPLSNNQKRIFALSKESGRKSARYFLDKYPELFFNDDAEPKISAFCYDDIYTDDMDVNESDLSLCISKNDVLNSITVYQNLVRKSVVINKKLQQTLLEMVCFYNSSQAPNEEYLERIWFSKEMKKVNSWISLGFAQTLFNGMSDKTSESYCAIIQGLAKFYSGTKAYKYYKEGLEQGFTFDVNTYNSIISLTTLIRESSQLRWEFIIETLNTMNNGNIKPNIGTLNAVLGVLSACKSWNLAGSLARTTLSEFKGLDISPSLATYYFLLQIFYKDKSRSSPILYEILDEIEDCSFQIVHPNDVNFFSMAMEICNSHLYDVNLAYRLQAFLHTGENKRFIGGAQKESIYYRSFFHIISETESMDTIMEIYNRYIPTVYTPELSVLSSVISAIKLNEAYHYVDQIWNDMIMFQYFKQSYLPDLILSFMSSKKLDVELQTRFVEFAWFYVTTLKNSFSNERENPMECTPFMLENCIKIFLNNEDFEKTQFTVDIFKNYEFNLRGCLTSDSLDLICTAMLHAQKYDSLIFCLKYAVSLGYTNVLLHMQAKIDEFGLGESIKKAIDQMIGEPTK